MTHQNAGRDTSLQNVASRTAKFLLTLFIVWALFLAWQYPMVVEVAYRNNLWERGLSLWGYYSSSYLNSNPRIGELAAYAASSSKMAGTLIVTASNCLLILASFVVAKGRLPRMSRAGDCAFIAVFVAVILVSNRQSGVMLFYPTYNTNYVLGFGLLLSFLAIPRAVYQGTIPEAKYLLWLAPLAGIVAGMTNEHTVPVVVLFLAAGLVALWKMSRIQGWHLTGFAGLVAGYMGLFFAPGQGSRYSGSKFDGLGSLLETLPHKLHVIEYHLLDQAWPFVWATVAMLILLTLLRRFNSRTFIATIALAAFVVMSAILVIAPFIVDRMVFPHHVLLAISFTAAASEALRSHRPLFLTAGGVAALWLFGFFLDATDWITRFRSDTDARRVIALHQIGEGNADVIVPPLDYSGPEAGRFIIREIIKDDPDWGVNTVMAEQYGADTLRVLP